MARRIDTPTRIRRDRDRGYSFGELLVTVVLVGLLASIVTATIRNVTAEAADSGCRLDAHQVHLAATSYLEMEDAEAIPATGDDPDRYERTLIEAGYLRTASEWYELDPDGSLMLQEDSPC